MNDVMEEYICPDCGRCFLAYTDGECRACKRRNKQEKEE
jgi:hypothetical protein